MCHKRERAITCILFGDLHFEFLCFGLLQKEVRRKFFKHEFIIVMLLTQGLPDLVYYG